MCFEVIEYTNQKLKSWCQKLFQKTDLVDQFTANRFQWVSHHCRKRKIRKLCKGLQINARRYHASHWILPVIIDENKIPHFTQVVTVTKRNQAVLFSKSNSGYSRTMIRICPFKGNLIIMIISSFLKTTEIGWDDY